MWTLAPGLIAVLNGDRGVLADLRTRATHRLDSADVPLVRRLAFGAGEHSAPPAMSVLAGHGWAVERQDDDVTDPVLRQRLAVLDRRYAWCAPAALHAVHDAIARAHARRRLFNQGFGQCAALPETVVRRVAQAGAAGKQVLVLGDDDLLSVGLQRAGHEVVTVEIDDYVVAVLRQCCCAEATAEVHAWDLREPWPEAWRGRFDLFFTDPMSGDPMLRLCLARGLAGLKPGGRGYVCVSEAGLPLFESVRRAMRFEVRDHWSDFNHYYGPRLELSPYTSDLLCVQPGVDTLLDPAPESCVFSRHLLAEQTLRASRVGCWLLQGIDVDKAEMRDIASVVDGLKHIGHLRPTHEHKMHYGDQHLHLAVTERGVVVQILVDKPARTAQVFVAPSDASIETSVVECLASALGIEGTVVQKHRIRNATVHRLYQQPV